MMAGKGRGSLKRTRFWYMFEGHTFAIVGEVVDNVRSIAVADMGDWNITKILRENELTADAAIWLWR